MHKENSHESALTHAETLITEQLNQLIQQNDDKQLIIGLEILHKLIQNIMKNPHDDKFRTIKKSNAAIQKKLMNLRGIQQLIETLGYLDIDEEHYVFVGDYFLILISGSQKIETLIDKLKLKYMSPEERKKQELLDQQKQEVREMQQKKQDYIKLMQRQSEEDRCRKAEQKATTSVANPLNFGANIVKFQPPPEQKRG